MAVAYQELDDSPTIRMDRRGGSATRKVLIAWKDIEPFMLEVFPSPFNGYGTASYPRFPWLVVDSVDVGPFVPAPRGNNEPINTFPGGALITVNYKPPDMEGGMQGGPKGDPSGPGGKDGSSGGQQGSDQTFVTHEVDIGGTFITYPSKNFRWHYPSTSAVAFAQDNEYAVAGDTITGVIQPHAEHTISWHQVAWPPWAAIRQCLGKVNAYRFGGAPRGTLLFLGAKAKREFTNKGVKAWTLDFKVSEKNANASNPLNPRGWNYFLRPDGKRAGMFELLHRTVPVIELPVESGQARFGRPRCRLAADAGAGTLTLTVDSFGPAFFPAEGQFRISVGDDPRNYELMEVIVVNDTRWRVLRGIDGTKRHNFAAGTHVYQENGLVYESADYRYLFTPGNPLF